MNYRTLGHTDIRVSEICLGGMMLTPDPLWGPQDLAQSTAAIHAALDLGVNFFDTAEGYAAGDSETLLGKTLASRRSSVVIATKVSQSNLLPDELRLSCEQSLRRLNTDYIDLYQVHWPNPAVPLADTLGAMSELQRRGKIRAIGVSNFGPGYLSDALALAPVQSDQIPYSLLWRPVEHTLQPFCRDRLVSILCYSPLCQGLLTGKFASPDSVPTARTRTRLFSGSRPTSRHGEPGCESETFAAISEIRAICAELNLPMEAVALAWLLARPAVAAVIAGVRTPSQVRANVRASELSLAPTVVDRLARATDPVKALLGSNVDPWQHLSRLDKPSEVSR